MDMEVRPNHPLSLRQLRVGRHRNLRGAGMRPTKGWENLGEIVYRQIMGIRVRIIPAEQDQIP